MTNLEALLPHMLCEDAREQVIVLAVVRGLTTHQAHRQIAEAFVNYFTLQDPNRLAGMSYIGVPPVSSSTQRALHDLFCEIDREKMEDLFALRCKELQFEFEGAADHVERRNSSAANAYRRLSALIGPPELARRDFDGYKSPAQVSLERSYARQESAWRALTEH